MDDKQYVLLSDILADIEYKLNTVKSILDENSNTMSEHEKIYYTGKLDAYRNIRLTIVSKYMPL